MATVANSNVKREFVFSLTFLIFKEYKNNHTARSQAQQTAWLVVAH
ncbi:hypothetical protein HMPREF1557_00487 [Streptococcus sobrinus W1703]|uniref:Uncharacterized protein n=1 Tax=Streptococcus sobrinus W1703 TaxID=1227275 RepID=U2IVF0_9STRE|nr:hypothetical protein HMPREF1557_00487 [Streptococcus sobrinus W1703]